MRSVSSPRLCSSSMTCVIVRVVLKAAAGVDDAGEAEAIQFAHEVARRIQSDPRASSFGPFGERR